MAAAAPIASSRVERAWAVLHEVPDPEVPVISVTDLGIVRAVVAHDDALEVVVTPTYSGCPATEAIAQAIVEAVEAAGLGPARVTQRRAPAWTTDWITPAGREKLRACGIAPPGACATPAAGKVAPIRLVARDVACPRCGSALTERLSAFGSTACKSLYRCIACREPFEHFKPI
jgi:ring-1,2-phenylacetyl-CoA epoxidase subunit PaaD